MTILPPPEESPSAGRSNSEGLSIEIYLFHCGHGDTILVRLPNDCWGMIDCYLPEQYGIRKEFFRFIEKKKVKTSDFIFQTHPHRDHYHGMQAVIEHFLRRGQKIKCYIDTGLNAERARALLQGEPGAPTEYGDLQDRLAEWRDAGYLVEWGELAARVLSVVPDGYEDQIEFVPIGPDPGEKRRIMEIDLRRLGINPKTRPEANELSLVIVLAVKMIDRTLNVLLSADAGLDSLVWALDYWRQRARRMGRDAELDAIKIPHHGSIKSHVPDLCLMKRPGTRGETAAVSAGIRRVLPDREVLRDYLANGWNVMATTKKGGSSETSLPMMLADRGAPDEGDRVRHTIRLSWSPASGLSAEPAAAKVIMGDLTQYETALARESKAGPNS